MTKSKDKSASTADSSRTTTGKPTSARLLRNRPLDQKDDDVEVRPPSLRDKAFEEAAEQLTPEEIAAKDAQVEHPALLADEAEAKAPIAVQNDRMHATYLGLGLEREKDQRLVHLDFSFPLELVHNGYLPRKVKDAWEYLISSKNKMIQILGVPAVTLSLYQSPASKKATLHLVGADFAKAIVSIIEEVGKGKTKKVTRFAFRLLVPRTEEIIAFAAWHDGEDFWITMPTTQKNIGDN